MAKKIAVTDVALRDGHQSLLATRMLTSDMLKIAEKMDKVGYWSLETWGGATFDSCIRFLNEDPWERIRNLKKAMPNTKMQMLLRGQNLLGYRHYADDVVEKFVEIGVPQEWVEVIQKAGFATLDELKSCNPNKLHADICGLNKKFKLELKNPTPDEVRTWVGNIK